ncbi:MAG: tetratricopeptide repeat protein, partial [Chitinophagaceae bacterium]
MKGFVVLIIIHSLFGCSLALAQPNTTIDLEKEKPKQYQTRLLRSEKTGDGKLKYPGKIFQNAFSHYNYYFNANNKVNEIIAKVKQTHRDDFTKLLPFYNYQYRQTASYTNDIDSIILKCTAGIFLHDLRSDWVDNLYLLIGKAYLLKESYDSAAYVFQYINYAWAPNDDGYILTIGSNNGQKNSIFSIVTPEKRSFLQKLTHRTISRNESLLWMARTYIEQQKNNEASSLLAMLTADPAFPQRLQPQLHELWAYHYYQQKLNDSAAFHIEKALSVTSNKTEKARWLFLAGQLLQQIKQDSAATRYYERSIQATPDPLLEVYARLNMVQMGSNKQKKGSDDHLQQLYQLSKKDKYENYRDIILLVAAQLEMENKNLTAATNTALKSIKYNTDNPETKNKAWLLLADLYYTQNKYVQSAACYDSLDINAIASDQLE